MTATPVIPIPGTAWFITTGGTAVTAVPAAPNGGFITNPLLAADQGISPSEVLYIDPTGSTPGSTDGSGNDTTFVLQPGQNWNLIPGQTSPTRVNAASSGHKFSVVYY